MAEFVEGDGLVLFFVELFFNGVDDVTGLPLAFSCDLLDVFYANANSVHTVAFFSCFFFFWFSFWIAVLPLLPFCMLAAL